MNTQAKKTSNKAKALIAGILLTASISNVHAQMQDYATDPNLTPAVRTFLKAIHGGPGIETLSKEDARKVLEGAQSSVQFDYSLVTESAKTITEDGTTVKIFVMRPKAAKGVLPAFIFV